ncbi:MAG: hypothetical protein OXN44_08565 [Acidimicrobiaceae bacterium]|nr:hypothetical protein [Acidimicrobiaceae bacterium]MDE0607917.1 hypothetical protein [Acidimicrobiaceae bacterium]
MSIDDSLHELISVWPHAGRAAELVCSLKYGRDTTAVSELARAMADAAPEADLVTWVPASPSRRRQRGFDQGELLARALARRRRVRIRRLLRRSDDDPQTGRDREGRVAGPSLKSCGPVLRSSPTVLVVDDVSTTGTTLRCSAAVLRSMGAGTVYGLVATQALSM